VIDVRLLRTDPDGVRSALARRGDTAVLTQLDDATRLDARLREITSARDDIRSQVNAISKQVGQLRRSGSDADIAEAEQLQATSRAFGADEDRLAAEHDEVEAALREVLLAIPNLPHPDAPDGVDDSENQTGWPMTCVAAPSNTSV